MVTRVIHVTVTLAVTVGGAASDKEAIAIAKGDWEKLGQQFDCTAEVFESYEDKPVRKGIGSY